VTIAEAWAGSWWITSAGITGLAVVMAVAGSLVAWTLPVALPMIFAPVLIALTSRPMPAASWLWRVPEEAAPTPVLLEWQHVHQGWTGPTAITSESFSAGAANVLG
jgi:membrane glycosyltransferase